MNDRFDLSLQNVSGGPNTVDDVHRYVKSGDKVLSE